jgi:hypothetical protein|tara:strand:- start:6035 stop:6304 length:270 start_codon:yes stop_codon:yes gene_type:complete
MIKENKMNKFLLGSIILLMSGCLTLSGEYQAFVFDADGKQLNQNLILRASGSGIYSLRNSVCNAYPGATITIIDVETGEELESESPYQC